MYAFPRSLIIGTRGSTFACLLGTLASWADPSTSREHGEKEPHSLSHCGSFAHHALSSLNNYIIVFLDLPTGTLSILGLVIYR